MRANRILQAQIIFTLALVLLYVQSCAPTPVPTPTPMTPFATPELATDVHTNYLPTVLTRLCNTKDARLGLAYALDYHTYKDVLQELCLNPASSVRTWSYKNQILDDFNFVPVVWDTQYIEPFKNYYDNKHVGLVLAYNEPGANAQAGGNYQDIAYNLIQLHSWCLQSPIRDCDIFAPGFASDDRLAQGRGYFNDAVSNLGGNPEWFSCDEHLYIFPEHIPDFDISRVGDRAYVKQQLEEELHIRLTALRNAHCRRIIVSEIGVCFDWSFADYWLQYQIDYLLTQSDVEGVYVFMDSKYYSFQPCAYYLSQGGELTGIGVGVIGAGIVPTGFSPSSYP